MGVQFRWFALPYSHRTLNIKEMTAKKEKVKTQRDKENEIKQQAIKAKASDEVLGTPEPKKEVDTSDIKVIDPKVYKPEELPLVVTGDWKNEAQEAFVKVLNAYAYKNPDKWHAKKDVLIAQLKEMETNPELAKRIMRAGSGKISFKKENQQGNY